MNQIIDQGFVDRFHATEQLFKANRIAEAREGYEALLREHPGQIAVLNNLGLIHEKTGDYERALSCYQQCHAQDPKQIVFINNLANVLCKLGRWLEARPLLEQAVAREFDFEQNAERYALCLFNTRPAADARESIESLISRFPDNERLNRLLGRTLLIEGRHAEGLRRLQKGSGTISLNDRQVTYLQ